MNLPSIPEEVDPMMVDGEHLQVDQNDPLLNGAQAAPDIDSLIMLWVYYRTENSQDAETQSAMNEINLHRSSKVIRDFTAIVAGMIWAMAMYPTMYQLLKDEVVQDKHLHLLHLISSVNFIMAFYISTNIMNPCRVNKNERHISLSIGWLLGVLATNCICGYNHIEIFSVDFWDVYSDLWPFATSLIFSIYPLCAFWSLTWPEPSIEGRILTTSKMFKLLYQFCVLTFLMSISMGWGLYTSSQILAQVEKLAMLSIIWVAEFTIAIVVLNYFVN